MSDDKNKTFRKTVEGMNIDLADLFGSLGGALGGALNEAVERLSRDADIRVDKVEDVPGQQGPVRSHTSLRLRVGGLNVTMEHEAPEDAPEDAAAAEAPETAENIPPARPIHYELHSDAEGWTLSAELPGVPLEEVQLTVEGAELTIETTGARRYRQSLTLPEPCAAETLSRHLEHGILTLRPGGQA